MLTQKKIDELRVDLAPKILAVEDINLLDVWAYYPFCEWLYENGWEPYVERDRYINMKAGKIVATAKMLFAEFREENPKYFQ